VYGSKLVAQALAEQVDAECREEGARVAIQVIHGASRMKL
jgi:hypothetical protein